jgi:hypothetical protein
MSVDLIIGNTSQQSYYYPMDWLRVSSRHIDVESLLNIKYGTVVISFAEQRINDSDIDYLGVNFTKTLEIINLLLDLSDRIVIFGTCELWSRKKGIISISDGFDFDISNLYTLSKLLLINEIQRLRKGDTRYNKVKIIHPFYFNSKYRSRYFLFGKIYESLINQNRISVNTLDFYRDIIHASFFVKKVLEAEEDMLIGAGKLFNIRDYVSDIYSHFGHKYSDFIDEKKEYRVEEKLIRPDVTWQYTYCDLVEQTINDLR